LAAAEGMAKQGRVIRMAYREQIIKLDQQGIPIRKIAVSLGLARNTVRRYLRDVPRDRPEALSRGGWAGTIDWGALLKRHQSGIQINQLYEEHSPSGVSLPTFYRRFSLVKEKSPLVALSQTHKPAEKVQIDYTDVVRRFSGLESDSGHFGHRLKFARAIAGQDHREVARLAGIDPSTVLAWEQLASPPAYGGR